MIKVLFLDIDGALLTTRSKLAANNPEQFDIVACQLIDKLCNYCGAKIVISSTWREGENKQSLLDTLEYNDISSSHLHDDWATPVLKEDRQAEIDAWLKNHKDITHWAIVDDGIGLDESSPRLVQPDFDEGLQFRNVINLLAILDGDTEQWFKDSDVMLSESDKIHIFSIKSRL